LTVGLVQLRCSLIDLQILSRIRFDEAWVGSRGSSKTLMPSKMSVSYLRKSLFDGYSYQDRFLKIDMGTKGPVRITRMDLPVIVELEHLVFVSISIIVLVLAPLGSPVVLRYQPLFIKRPRFERGIGSYGSYEYRTFWGKFSTMHCSTTHAAKRAPSNMRDV